MDAFRTRRGAEELPAATWKAARWLKCQNGKHQATDGGTRRVPLGKALTRRQRREKNEKYIKNDSHPQKKDVCAKCKDCRHVLQNVVLRELAGTIGVARGASFPQRAHPESTRVVAQTRQ